ncbi:hypothetical protein [Agromyces protaetiae]|uniref:hypothetical protein n=1 Tax=Agromyces protaetiae TaxID=2509455 RepID=UPI001FB7B97C|nr:hypothetical protein [Agromyces protaetiae]
MVQAFVAVTAAAGGVGLMIGALVPETASVLNPAPEYLEGSPFASYLVPGIILALGLGGVHVAAFVALLRRVPAALFIAAATGYVTLIWIFVQMIIIPFSFLQAMYFAAGCLELGFVLLLLGLLPWRKPGGQQFERATAEGVSRPRGSRVL